MFMSRVKRVLFLSDLFDKRGQVPILVHQDPIVGWQEQTLVHLQELHVRVHVVIVVGGQLVAIAVKTQLSFVDLKHVAIVGSS